ncbi:MAG: SpoIIE family protein phosphatase [Eubacteriales bacterium]|mgnify:FL=1|uniref:SpoIIE family protein phosphatase n=1 Tax=Baileyella intestinalis TaxID=2606709 RepID=A0A6A8M8N5_9FIRM|nr:SpoIIE family protein phosphatase [Baileyella intestinalis]MCI7685607.1 serine/threonine-protein phosphatase [Clostridiales bacterium]MDY2994699.1 SpoIIE family protein phosphatase [Baileyella intestinalis]MST68589.1 SpoIIE family protein phosphatase [Baileyella intestinalis]
MNDLSVDIGYRSINHVDEQLCGDHVDVVEQGPNSRVVVLADGLGSGVKASILSTLTSKIISTMMAEGLSLEECVRTIIATLPVNKDHGVAYSTFTIIHIIENETAEVIQFENPQVIMIRDNKVFEYETIETVIDGNKVLRSVIALEEGDIFVAMSDGCPHANAERTYNMNWKVSDIADFMATISHVGYTAKTLAAILIEECNKLYDGKPLDDATACIVRVIKRQQVNLLFGPPADPDDCDRMMTLFFSKKGKKIICGGTTAKIAADYLGKPITYTTKIVSRDVPPTSEIEGVDLVTEGIVTMDKVLKYAKEYLDRDEGYMQWGFQHDAAAEISRILFEEATDINFMVGKAINPAHRGSSNSISFNVKVNLIGELTKCLESMGKNVKVSLF